jgi:hypothetical protein
MLSQDLIKELTRELVEDFKNNIGFGSFRDEVVKALLSTALVANLATDLNLTGEDEESLVDKIIIQSNNDDVLENLQKAEEKIDRALNASVDSTPDGDADDDDDDEAHGAKSQFPNLKYNKPKYKNLESVLKYVETKKKPGDAGGDVRIVIMNFND